MRAVSLLLAALPLAASALQVITPTDWKGNSTVSIAWTWVTTDPPFSVELGNPDIHDGLLAQGPIAVANNLQPNQNKVAFQLPELPPGANYFIRFVDIADINTVYSTSDPFNIASNPVTTTSFSSTTRASTAPLSGFSTSTPTSTISGTTLIVSPTSTPSATSTHNSGAGSIFIRGHETTWSSSLAMGALVSMGAVLAGMSVL